MWKISTYSINIPHKLFSTPTHMRKTVLAIEKTVLLQKDNTKTRITRNCSVSDRLSFPTHTYEVQTEVSQRHSLPALVAILYSSRDLVICKSYKS